MKTSTKFTIDASNSLVITQSFKKKHTKKVVIDGTWTLTPEHDLRFHVLGSDPSDSAKTLIFSGSIENIGGNKLSFRIRDCEGLSGFKTSTVQLTGRWQADKDNRITFHVAKNKGIYDVLRFQGAWQVSRKNEIIYKYKEIARKKRVKKENTLTFKGHWELKRNKLVYSLQGALNSFFEFKAALRSKSLRASDGVIKYLVGIKYSSGKSKRNRKQVVAIHGTWKFGKNLKLGYEVEYSWKNKRTIFFQISELFAKGNVLTLSLRNSAAEPLGLKLTFRKAFKDDAELFLTLGKYASESRITGGLRVKF